jgi:hypothetical protein
VKFEWSNHEWNQLVQSPLKQKQSTSQADRCVVTGDLAILIATWFNRYHSKSIIYHDEREGHEGNYLINIENFVFFVLFVVTYSLMLNTLTISIAYPVLPAENYNTPQVSKNSVRK